MGRVGSGVESGLGAEGASAGEPEGVAWTEERLADGALLLRQPRYGYRYGLDAMLLAALTPCGTTERAVDLGTGCGVVALLMACRGRGRDWVGVEIQEELVRLARENVQRNGFGERVRIERADFGDIAAVLPGGCWDLVVSNPPYHRQGGGRISPDPQRHVARHEQGDTLTKLCRAAAYLLRPRGRLALMYPAARLGDLLQAAAAAGLGGLRVTAVYTRPGAPARRLHLLGTKAVRSELVLAPPVFVPPPDAPADAAWGCGSGITRPESRGGAGVLGMSPL